MYCSTHLPAKQLYSLPQRFNVKGKEGKTIFPVCSGCLKQVNARRLSILSELAQQEQAQLHHYIDLNIVSSDTPEDSVNTIGSLQYLDFSRLSTQQQLPTTSHFGGGGGAKSLQQSRAFPNGSNDNTYTPLNGTLLHSFSGISVNTSVHQLYEFIITTTSPETTHLNNIVLKHKNGQILRLEELQFASVKGLMPNVVLASDADIAAFKAQNGGAAPPCPANFLELLAKREAEKQAKLERKASRAVAAAAAAAAQHVEHDGSNASTGDMGSEAVSTSTNANNNNDSTTTTDTNQSAEKRKDKKKKEYVVAIHTYMHQQAANAAADDGGDDDKKSAQILSFVKHDRFLMIPQQSGTTDWMFVITGDGLRKGWVPRSYVMDEEKYLALKKKREMKKKQSVFADSSASASTSATLVPHPE